MNAKEFMDAVGGISDENIVKYAEVSPVIVKGKTEKEVKGMNKLKIWLSAAAAVLVLGVGIFAVSRFVKNPGTEYSASVPTTNPTDVDPAQTALLPTEDARRIVSGENGTVEEEIAKVGQRLLLPSLENAVKAPENEGCLFDVELWIYNFADVDAYIEEQWAKVIEKKNDPAILRYNEEYEYWLENIYEPTEDDIKAQENGKGREAEYFAAYWVENYPQDVQDAYTAAQEAARAARTEYDANTSREALKPMKDAAMAKLLAALAENGYELEQGETLNDIIYKAHGLLTRDQIENFPVEDCGVFILWSGYEGGIDE